MKKTFLLLLGFALMALSFSNVKDNINFRSGSWNEVGKEAKASSKGIFAMVCSKTCPLCARMKKDVFTDPEVAAYMNDKYVSIMLDPEDPMTNMRITNWGLKSVPAVVFLDSKKNVQIASSGYKNAEQLLELAKKAAE